MCSSDLTSPDAFRTPNDLALPDGSMGPDRVMVYFSITTITTLGYGDITPRGEMARSLSNLEALLGQEAEQGVGDRQPLEGGARREADGRRHGRTLPSRSARNTP